MTDHASTPSPVQPDTHVLCKMGARRRAQLALRGFRAPPSEPDVHLSLRTGLSTDVVREGRGLQPSEFELPDVDRCGLEDCETIVPPP